MIIIIQEAGKAVERVYSHYHAPQARRVHRLVTSAALADIMDSNFFQEFFVRGAASRNHGNGAEEEEAVSSEEPAASARLPSMDTVSAVSLDLQRCSMSDLYARVNRDGAKLKCQMLDLGSMTRSIASLGSRCSSDGNDVGRKDGASKEEEGASKEGEGASKEGEGASKEGEGASEESLVDRPRRPSSSSASDSGASVHSDDLFDTEDGSPSEQPPRGRGAQTEPIRSSQTVASVLSLFDSVVSPYHAKVREVLAAQSVMDKMRAVWQSVDLLSQKTGEVCKARGMDTLLPMSIFATASFTEDLFIDYYVQLLILTDLKPAFAFHSMYDFSLTNALATYMFLFEARFSGRASARSSREEVSLV